MHWGSHIQLRTLLLLEVDPPAGHSFSGSQQGEDAWPLPQIPLMGGGAGVVGSGLTNSPLTASHSYCKSVLGLNRPMLSVTPPPPLAASGVQEELQEGVAPAATGASTAPPQGKEGRKLSQGGGGPSDAPQRRAKGARGVV